MISPRIPVEDFCRDPAISNVHLSPSGIKISLVAPGKTHQSIFVRSGPNAESKEVTAEAAGDVTSYFWKSDRYLMYQAYDASLSLWLYRCDLEQGSATPILQLTNEKGDYVVDINFVDDLKWHSDEEVLAELRPPIVPVDGVYRINVCSKEVRWRLVAEVPDPKQFGTVQKWIVDNNGEVRGAISVQGTNDHLLTRADPAGPFKIVRTMEFTQSIEDQFYPYLFYTADNKGIYAITRTHPRRNTAAVVILCAETGQEISCLYQNPEVDVASFGFSHRRKVVTHVTFHDDKLRNKALDPAAEPIFKTLRASSRGSVLQILDSDVKEKHFIVLASDDRTPGRYYLLDASNQHKHKLTPLGDKAPWLNRKYLARSRPIKFAARDGLAIRGYLTLPLGKKAKRLPLIINVHGGPENRNYWDYSSGSLYSGEIQFLANRGYATLQLNFRGSIGYGRSFWTKGFGQRGRKMQHDVTDAVRWIKKQGIADPKRIVIYGKSYGGYAALAGVAFTPNLFCAAIDCSGVSDWLTWLQESFSPGDPLFEQFCVKVGSPTKDEARLAAVAPVRHASKITKPVFIAHGMLDQQVDPKESQRMVDALLAAGRRDVQYLKVPGEDHIFRKPDSKVALCKTMEEFLNQYLI